MDSGGLTGYDDLVIYSRCLSPQEIRKGYETYYPNSGASQTNTNVPPAVRIPMLAKEIVLDGKIDESEWSDAAKIPVDRLYPKSENRKLGKSAWAWVKYDDRNLYIAMKSDRPAAVARATERDSDAWQDDCFEIHLIPGSGNYRYQFVLNANNALFDLRADKNGVDSSKNWNGTAMTAAVKTNDSWTAEFIIPFQNIGGLFPDQKFQANFAYLNCRSGNNQYSWAWVSPLHAFGDPEYAGTVTWGKQGEGVSLESFGNVFQGKFALHICPVNPAKAKQIETKATLLIDGMVQPVQSGNITGREWTHTLSTGKHSLCWESKVDSVVIARGKHEFEVSKPLEISFECHGEKHYVDVSINMNNSGNEALERLYKTGLNGKVYLESAKGETISEKAFSTKGTAVVTLRLPLPLDIVSGKYSLKAKLDFSKDLADSVDFHVPDMTPYKLKVAIDHTVPSPWGAVKEKGAKTWTVLNRTFVFENGPLPIAIKNEGNEMFSAAPEYTLATNQGKVKIQWSDFRTGKNYGDYVEFFGTGKGGNINFIWNGELWFDGTYKWKIDFAPEKDPVMIQSFRLGWTMPAEFAKYVMHPLFVPWGKDGTIRLHWATTPEEDTMCWILGIRKGISWWCESDANWSNGKDEKQITITRAADRKAKVDITMISVPVELKRNAFYTMTLTATPQRPLAKKARDFEFYGKDCELGWRREEKTSSDNCLIRLIRKYTARHWEKQSNAGQKILQYTCPFYLDAWETHYAYFFHDWKKRPIQMWGTKNYANGDVPVMAESVCSGSNMFDIYAWREEKLFKDYPDLAGIYFDCCHCPECANEEHGCGGIDAFGKRYMTNTAWKLRGNLIRSIKLHRKYNRCMILHGHNKFNPIAHGFGDYWWPGEEYTTYPDGMSPVFLYCDMPDEWLQSAYNSEVRGLGIIILPENERAVAYVKDIRQRIEKDGGWELATWAHMTPFLLHDTNLCWALLKNKDLIRKWWKIKSEIKIDEADFVGYWFEKVITTNAPRVYASWYKWSEGSKAPYIRVIIVGNLDRIRQKFCLTIDRKALGIEGKTIQFVDLWNDNKPLSEQDLKNLTLDAAHFMVIGIKDTH